MVMVGRQETEHDGEISRTVHKDLWKMKLKNYILHQTTATATKLQTERSQPLWIQGQNSDRKLPLIQETRGTKQMTEGMCKEIRKEIDKQANKPSPPTKHTQKGNSVRKNNKQ